MGICTASAGEVGDPCIYSERCQAGLYCSIPRTCQAEGGGTMFSECTDSGDCTRPLVCAPQPDGSRRCVNAGDGDIGPPGDACETVADCLPGLFCIDGRCTSSGGALPDGGVDAGDAATDTAVDVGRPCEDRVDCDDDNDCTIDQCVGEMCRNTLNDGDEDGYASNVIGSCGLDCNDMDADVSPDHTDFETVRQMDMLPGTPDNFDWNCDGIEERQYPTGVPDCDGTGVGTCTMGEGWLGTVPGCGMTGTWARCTGPGDGCTLSTIETRTQGCR
jgi:hypothetical protein